MHARVHDQAQATPEVRLSRPASTEANDQAKAHEIEHRVFDLVPLTEANPNTVRLTPEVSSTWRSTWSRRQRPHPVRAWLPAACVERSSSRRLANGYLGGKRALNVTSPGRP